MANVPICRRVAYSRNRRGHRGSVWITNLEIAQMNTMTLRVALGAAIGLSLGTLAVPALAASYNYHGSLQDAGKAANGSYDLKLTLYSAKAGGSVVAGPVTLYGVKVSDGNFVSDVDFGPLAMLNQAGWVGVEVKAAGGEFVALDNRSSVAAPEAGCPGSWALDGNAGNPTGSYLGTADAQALTFKVNSKFAASIYDTATQPVFVTNGSVGLAFPDVVNGKNSVAVGYHGNTLHDGTFNFSPQTGTIATVPTTATNQFIVNAPHGVGINTASAPDGNPLRDELTIRPSPDLPGTNADLTFETSTTAGYSGFNFAAEPGGYFEIDALYNTAGALGYDPMMRINYANGTHSGFFGFSGANATSTAAIRVGTNTSNGNGAFLSPTGNWTNASSRTFKDAFASIDPVNVLEKLVAMPVKTWFYKGAHADGLHMGPVAEDFASTFGLGSNEKYIGSVDESGVAFAAIQGLNHKMEAKARQMQTENTALKQQNSKLQSSLDAVVARLDKLESRRGE